MQAVMILTVAFALLTGYLEHTTSEAEASSSSVMASVVRINQALPEVPVPVPEQQVYTFQHTAVTPALDLSLPFNLREGPAYQRQPSSFINRINQRKTDREKVTYEAELVFDAHKGEDITGGKINIKIPLT